MANLIFHAAFSRDFLNDAGELAYGDIGLSLLDQSPRVSYRFLDGYTQVVTPEQIAEVDALVVIYPHVTPETFERGAGRLAFIGRCGVGYDRIDVAACTANDVALTNAPQAMRLPTASGALTLMLVLSKRLMELERLTRQGRWDLRAGVQSIELPGRTLGIVGLGNSGRELARLVAPFEMRVIAYSPHADLEQARQLNVQLVSLETLLREADFVCLHCRLTDETRGLIGARELALMKPAAYLINMARGPVVDHAALVAALAERRIAGAGLDVFHTEPLPPDDPITQLDNVVVAPHWLAGTRDAFLYAGRTNCEAILRAARGELPENIVNREVIDRPGFQKKLARFRG
ncbi:MAG: NAD(P)-dependent oxidoreductase [Anaerolineales bacterium]